MINQFNQLLAPIKRKMLLILGRALVTAVNDDGEFQKLQVSILKNEVKDQMIRYQNYGFTSHPHPGAQAVTIFNGGNRNNGVVVCVDDKRYRIKALKRGEVAIYTDEGDSIVFGRENKMTITTKVFTLNTDDCIINTKKFKVFDGSNDLTASLIEWMNEVITATTSTMIGPMKLVGAKFPSIKTKIESFKK